MNPEWLKNYVNELKIRLDYFQQIIYQLEERYERSQQSVTDPAMKSILMEQYTMQKHRQQKASAAMQKLYQQAANQLVRMEAQQARSTANTAKASDEGTTPL